MNSAIIIPEEIFWLENAGYSIVLDADSSQAFGKICQFLDKVHLSTGSA